MILCCEKGESLVEFHNWAEVFTDENVAAATVCVCGLLQFCNRGLCCGWVDFGQRLGTARPAAEVAEDLF